MKSNHKIFNDVIFIMYLGFKTLIDDVICQLSHWKNWQKFRRLRNETGEYSLTGFDRLQCIYVHIPKAAGISINKALFGNYGGGHKTVRMYKRIYGPITFKRYYKFTFVRNPYSRLLSAYHYLKKGGMNKNDRTWADKNLSNYDSFDEFVKKWLDEENIWTYVHFYPQYSFVCDINLNPEVDFVGKVETINDDFKKVCKKLEIPNDLTIYNSGDTEHTNWQNFYTDYTLDKVAKIYSKDFEIFNY